MKETELERLVVKLTGDGTTYTRMVNDANAQNKSLVASLKQVEDSQKKLEEKIKQSSGAWKSNSSAIAETTSALSKFGDQARSSSSLFDQYVSSVKAGLSEIRGELAKTAIAYADSMSGGYFDQNRTALQRGLAHLNPMMYVDTVRAGAAAARASMPSVVRDTSTFEYINGKYGAVRINPKTHRITERMAEDEDYNKSLKPHYEAIGKEEEARRRSLRRDDISHMPHRGDRMNALKKVLSDALNDEAILRSDTTIGGNGLMDEISRLESDVGAASSSAYESKRLGVKDPYQEKLAKKREELGKKRAELLDAEGRRRASTRDIEDTDRGFKHSDRAMVRGMEMDNATFGMSPDAARLHRMQAEGVHWSTISGVRGEMYQNRSNLHGKALEDDARDRSEIGMKPRAIRDKRLAEEMKKQSYTETQISEQVASNKKTDEAKDKQALLDTTKEYTKALNDESVALRNSRDSMQPYYETIKKLDEAIGRESDPTKKQELTGRRDSLKSSVGEHDKAGIVQRYGMSRGDQFKAEKKKLDDMRSDKTNPIDQETYNRALADLSQSYRSHGMGAPATNNGVFSTSDPGEAFARLQTFRENAFGSQGDMRGGPKARAMRKSKARQAALRRRKGVTVDELGDPTANMNFDFPGGDYQDPLSDLGVRPEEAAPIQAEGSSGQNFSVQEPVHDYWAAMGGERMIGGGTTPPKDEKKEEEEKKIGFLERIAKAVEKESDIKVEVSTLK